MRKSLSLAGAVAITGLLATPVAAQQVRTFVSGHGIDTGICGLGSPCRTFAYAITQTGAGGDMTVLDPAGYGTVNITKAVTIVNDGVGEAGVTVTTTGATAIHIIAGATDVINLRGLTLVGGGVGKYGIFFENGGTLNVQNCVIRGFSSDGIVAAPATTDSNFDFVDTVVSNNLGRGVWIAPAGPSVFVNASLSRMHLLGNDKGLVVDGGGGGDSLHASIVDSTISGNKSYGVTGVGGVTTPIVTVANSQVMSSSGSDISGFGASIYLSGNWLSGLAVPYDATQTTIISFGNNSISAGNSGAGTLSSKSPQ
jgi:hypothetical protein